MEQMKAGRDMFRFHYKHEHFSHGDREHLEQWIKWDEMYQ
jgi:hypothetical protein